MTPVHTAEPFIVECVYVLAGCRWAGAAWNRPTPGHTLIARGKRPRGQLAIEGLAMLLWTARCHS